MKFHPKLVEAWNELGTCFWKKGDIKAAKSCFESAIKEVCFEIYLCKRCIYKYLCSLCMNTKNSNYLLYKGVCLFKIYPNLFKKAIIFFLKKYNYYCILVTSVAWKN